ncbi:MAG: pseudouridine-5'-phosphate glycosidase [Devosiaceae bacterium]|nr:pseudouridine-5'-phosphate glycosidase [Devosiaceae bacterium]
MAFIDHMNISEEVADAIKDNSPVVALESTIITHGMPFPQNLDIALAVEAEVRNSGAVPATIAIMDGVLEVGISGDRLEELSERNEEAAKASRRDVASILVKGGLAGTTVATTMQIAKAADIKIFATGGIGGVHRGAEISFDISADLAELARTPVAVVCAGAKSILDIGKTLEVLESNGVPVIGYGSDSFPAFFSRDSGYFVDHRFDDVNDIALMIKTQNQLEMGGVLVAVPIPETDAMDGKKIEEIIQMALKEANEKGISRKDLTPYLLQKIFELSKGESLKANGALIRNNAAVAGKIAVALCELK